MLKKKKKIGTLKPNNVLYIRMFREMDGKTSMIFSFYLLLYSLTFHPLFG